MTVAYTTYDFTASDAPTKRTMPKRLSEIYNVKDFGAVGNGIADDTTAIRLALNTAWNTLALTGVSGGTVFFPPGIYRVTDTINITLDEVSPGASSSCLKIIGAGRDATMIIGNLPSLAVLYYGSTSDMLTDPSLETEFNGTNLLTVGVTLSDMTIKNESTSAHSRAVWFRGVGTAVGFKNLKFIGVAGWGSHFNTFHPYFHDCIAECITPGGTNEDSIGFYAHAGDWSNCVATGFKYGFVSVSTGGSVMGCRAVSCAIGFDCYSTTNPSGQSRGALNFFGNIADTCGIGFMFQGCNGVFAGNISRNSTTRGLDIHDVALMSFFAHTFDGDAADARIQQFGTTPNFIACVPASWTLPSGFHPSSKAYNFIDNSVAPFVSYTILSSDPEGYFYWATWEPWTVNIIDGSPGSAAFGATITGGGSDHYKIRYDGTNWIRIG